MIQYSRLGLKYNAYRKNKKTLTSQAATAKKKGLDKTNVALLLALAVVIIFFMIK